jgi:hypothetical protein
VPTFATLQAEADERSLIRKVQRLIICIAPTTVELPDALTGADSQPINLITAGYLPVGLVTPDGFVYNREIEKEDVEAMGYASPVRSDIIKAPRSVTFTTLEKGRKHMRELTLGTDLSGVTQAANGEVVIREQDLPIGQEYRLVVVGDDGPAANNWVLGMGFGLVKLSSAGGETWGREGALTQELTFDVFTDDEVGVPVVHYMGGTGAKASAELLGFTAATP